MVKPCLNKGRKEEEKREEKEEGGEAEEEEVERWRRRRSRGSEEEEDSRMQFPAGHAPLSPWGAGPHFRNVLPGTGTAPPEQEASATL